MTADGTVLAFAVERERGLRVARWAGHGPGDQLGPVYAEGGRAGAGEVLREALRAGDWDLFLGSGMAGDDDWGSLPGAHVLEREAGPVIDVPDGGWDAWFGSRSRNFRNQNRRRERELHADFEVTYRLADAASVQRDLDRLIELHEARWGGGSQAFDGPRRAFHAEVARRGLEEGWVRLWTLELDGRAAAAWYGFRIGGAEWFYQSGRDPALDERGIGWTLVNHTIRCAMEDGVREYRLLLGDESYKQRLASRDPGLELVAQARTLRGRLGLAYMRARRRGE